MEKKYKALNTALNNIKHLTNCNCIIITIITIIIKEVGWRRKSICRFGIREETGWNPGFDKL